MHSRGGRKVDLIAMFESQILPQVRSQMRSASDDSIEIDDTIEIADNVAHDVADDKNLFRLPDP